MAKRFFLSLFLLVLFSGIINTCKAMQSTSLAARYNKPFRPFRILRELATKKDQFIEAHKAGNSLQLLALFQMLNPALAQAVIKMCNNKELEQVIGKELSDALKEAVILTKNVKELVGSSDKSWTVKTTKDSLAIVNKGFSMKKWAQSSFGKISIASTITLSVILETLLIRGAFYYYAGMC